MRGTSLGRKTLRACQVANLLTLASSCGGSTHSARATVAPPVTPKVAAQAPDAQPTPPPACPSVASLSEACRSFADTYNVKDCGLASEKDLQAGALYELMIAWNPNAALKAQAPAGIGGNMWWVESPDFDARVMRLYVLHVGSTFYSLGETTTLPGLTEELEVLQPPELRASKKFQITKTTTTGVPPEEYRSQELSIVTLETPPRLVLRQTLSVGARTLEGETNAQGRQVLSVGADAALFSAETIMDADGTLIEVSAPAQARYCSGDPCPLACGAPTSEDVGSLEPERSTTVTIDGPYVTLTGRTGGRIHCFNEHTVHAHLLSCSVEGTARSIQIAHGADGELRCDEELPDYNYENGGYWSTDQGTLGTQQLVGVELSPELRAVFDAKSFRLELHGPETIDVIDFASEPTPQHTELDVRSSAARVPVHVIDLTSAGSGCDP